MTMNLQLENPFNWLWLALLAAVILGIAIAKKNALSPGRWYASLAVRLLTVILVLLALANPISRHQLTGKQAIIFLLDQSESISPEGKTRALEFVRGVQGLLDKNDAAGLVAFARTPRVIAAPAPDFEVHLPETPVDADATNIAGAVDLGLGLFPSESRRALVLLSDGNENIGRVLPAAAMAQKLGVTIHTVPLPSRETNAAGVEKLFVPGRVHTDEVFRLRAVLKNAADAPNPVRLVIRKDGKPILTRENLSLQPGATPLTMDYKLSDEGLHCFDLHLRSDDGETSNSPPAYISVVGVPRLLIVSPEASGRNFFNEVIRRRDFAIAEAATLPDSLGALLPYECIVLNDVPREALPDDRLRVLHHYVQDFGGGLITIGGGAGASLEKFNDTPLEEILPVRLDQRLMMKNRRDVAIILVIDRSGSMGGAKLEMAKGSALQTINELEAGDSVGILAFDSAPYWIVDLTVLGKDKSPVTGKLQQLAVGGGTDVYVAMEEVYRLLASKRMNIRQHVVLMTDGITSEAGLLEVAQQLARIKVSLTTIAIGADANVPILDQMRRPGNGEFHVITNFNELPNIVLHEVEEKEKVADQIDATFTPQIFHASPILTGIQQRDLPSLKGYVSSELKTAARKPLMTNFKNTEDPILAHWQYGLGRSAVFTAGVNSAWSDQWLEWRSFGKFWEQALRWTMRTRSPNEYFFQVRRLGNHLTIRVEIEAAEQSVPPELRGVLRLPNDRVIATAFERTAGGIFEGEFTVADSGMAHLALLDPGQAEGEMWFGAIYLPGPPPAKINGGELDGRGPDFQLLQELAQKTKGIFDPRPEEIITQTETLAVERSFGGYLLVLAMLLFLADVALRRIELPLHLVRAWSQKTHAKILQEVRKFVS